jgi:hypothetical protein
MSAEAPATLRTISHSKDKIISHLYFLQYLIRGQLTSTVCDLLSKRIVIFVY